MFVVARLASIILSVLTFGFGLGQNENAELDVGSGNFSSGIMRIVALAVSFVLQVQSKFDAVVVSVLSKIYKKRPSFLQGYMMQRFITLHLGRYRQRAAEMAAAANAAAELKKDKKAKKAKRDESLKKSAEDEISELPEVDQNTKSLRSRSAVKSK